MALKITFPVGESIVTVRGLYQWDYGQVLEIECNEIGSEILEAHFACPNMAEAIVRTCTFSSGFGTVTIPDECLEQTSAVTVWLCRVDETQRHTIKAITLPLTTRTRPSNTRDIPADYTDTYGQLIREVNEAINDLENGIITAANAGHASTAGHATTAGSSTNASYATSAGSANTLATNKTSHGSVSKSGISVSFKTDRAYLICATVDTVQITFILYISGSSVYSAQSKDGIFTYLLSGKLYFANSSGNVTASNVIIREI